MPLLSPSPVDKSELRRLARSRRRVLDAQARADAEERIALHLQARAQAERWRRVAAYAAAASEAGLGAWFAQLPSMIELCLPTIGADGTMRFRRWRPGELLHAGPFAIAQPAETSPAVEPESLDAALLPMLAFDAAGTRLGSGAGYYDRAFAFRIGRAPPPRLIGIAFAAQQVDALPRDAWDVPLDAVVTEHGWQQASG